MIGLHKPLRPGDVVVMTFAFENAPPMRVEFTAKKSAAVMQGQQTPMGKSMNKAAGKPMQKN